MHLTPHNCLYANFFGSRKLNGIQLLVINTGIGGSLGADEHKWRYLVQLASLTWFRLVSIWRPALLQCHTQYYFHLLTDYEPLGTSHLKKLNANSILFKKGKWKRVGNFRGCKRHANNNNTNNKHEKKKKRKKRTKKTWEAFGLGPGEIQAIATRMSFTLTQKEKKNENVEVLHTRMLSGVV